MKKNMAIIVLLILLAAVILGSVFEVKKQEKELATVNIELQQHGTPQLWKGKYTIFQYTRNGWTNRLYVTEYYIEDHTIYYKAREHQGEFLPVEFDGTLPAPGWIEDTEKLMDYGFWKIAE